MGDRAGEPEEGQGLAVHLLGVGQGLRTTGRGEAVWSKVPAGKRNSTYENPDYLKVASAFAAPTRDAIANADPLNPGVQPRPAPGIQFVGIPEFPALGTQVSQDVSSAIAGQMTVEQALDQGQQLAGDVAERYQSRLGS